SPRSLKARRLPSRRSFPTPARAPGPSPPVRPREPRRRTTVITIHKCKLGDIEIPDVTEMLQGVARDGAGNGQIGQVGWNIDQITLQRALGSAPGGAQRDVSQRLSTLTAGDYFELEIVLADPGNGNAVLNTIRADQAHVTSRVLHLTHGE